MSSPATATATPDQPVAATAESAPPTGWVASYLAVLLCYFLNFALFALAYPFIPLYLMEMGESESSAIAWTGLGQSLGSLALMAVNPLWGAVGDRFGRKSMALRAMLGGAVTLTLMGLSTSAWQVFGSRVLQGLVGGSTPALLTVAALTLPRSRMAFGMGLMQTAQFVGQSGGPLLGSLAASVVGFRGAFLAAAGVMAATIVLSVFVIRDPPTPVTLGKGPELSLWQRLAFVGRVPRLRGIIVATLLFQVAYSTSITLLPLHIHNLAGSQDAAAAVGMVLAASAAGGALGGVLLGTLAGRLNAAAMTVVAFLLTALMLLPQVWLTTTLQFVALRFLTDFCAGGILPALRTLLADEAAQHEVTATNMGTVYGLSQSAYSGGMALGAALSSGLATLWGIPTTFLAASLLAGATGAGWRWLVGPTRPPAR